MLMSLQLFVAFCHAPLGVCGAIRKHQPPQRAVLSQKKPLVTLNPCWLHFSSRC